MADIRSARSIAYTRAPFSTWLGIVCLFVLFGLIVLAVIGPSPRTSDYEETRAKKRMEKLKALHEESQKDLTTYAWVDKNKGVARIPKDPAVSAAAGDTEQLERAYIDASTRVPVLMFYTSAIAWLIVGTVLAMVVSFKLHSPDLLSGISFLTWGRLRPAHMNVMVYGWASMAGMGTAVWLMARLCRVTLRFPLLLVAGAGFWNLGVLLGVGGILWGDSTGYQWLEFPSYAAIILFVAYVLVASWAVLMFRFRRGEQIYISQWYLLGAFLWFPWLYAAGH